MKKAEKKFMIAEYVRTVNLFDAIVEKPDKKWLSKAGDLESQSLVLVRLATKFGFWDEMFSTYWAQRWEKTNSFQLNDEIASTEQPPLGG